MKIKVMIMQCLLFLTLSIQPLYAFFGDEKIEELESKVEQLEIDNMELEGKNQKNSKAITGLKIEKRGFEETIRLYEQQKKADLNLQQVEMQKRFNIIVDEKNQQIMEQNNTIERLLITINNKHFNQNKRFNSIIMEQNSTIKELSMQLNNKKYKNNKKFNEENKVKIEDDFAKKKIPYLIIGAIMLIFMVFLITKYLSNKHFNKENHKLSSDIINLKSEIDSLLKLHKQEKLTLENEMNTMLQEHKKTVNILNDEAEKSTKNHIIDYIKELKEKRDRNINLLK
jgi:outer membrane murein-binding lipoprotein Lpp